MTDLRCAPAFDPQPSIKTLEHALSLLLPLRKANAAKTAEIERSVAAAERAYRGDVRGAKAGFEVRPLSLLHRAEIDVVALRRLSIVSSWRSIPRLRTLDRRPSELVMISFVCRWISVAHFDGTTGEQLESIDRLRQRASEAHDLILYYNEFALGDTSRWVNFAFQRLASY